MVICWGSPAVGPAAYFVTLGTPPTKNEPWSHTSSGSSRYGFSSGFSHADALDADVAAISADVRARSGPFLTFMVCFSSDGVSRQAQEHASSQIGMSTFFSASALAANARLRS